jgi:hypothetical protein
MMKRIAITSSAAQMANREKKKRERRVGLLASTRDEAGASM